MRFLTVRTLDWVDLLFSWSSLGNPSRSASIYDTVVQLVEKIANLCNVVGIALMTEDPTTYKKRAFKAPGHQRIF